MPIADRIILLRFQTTPVFQRFRFWSVDWAYNPGHTLHSLRGFHCRWADIHRVPGEEGQSRTHPAQRVENGAEFPPKRSFFTERHGQIDMTSDRQRID